METLKQNGNAIIMCAIEAVAGILLLANPFGFTVSKTRRPDDIYQRA